MHVSNAPAPIGTGQPEPAVSYVVTDRRGNHSHLLSVEIFHFDLAKLIHDQLKPRLPNARLKGWQSLLEEDIAERRPRFERACQIEPLLIDDRLLRDEFVEDHLADLEAQPCALCDAAREAQR